jgi:hypothetical protein
MAHQDGGGKRAKTEPQCISVDDDTGSLFQTAVYVAIAKQCEEGTIRYADANLLISTAKER